MELGTALPIHRSLGTFPFTSFTLTAVRTQEMLTYAVIISYSEYKQIQQIRR